MLPFELAFSGELWSVFWEYFNRNWPCYRGLLLYVIARMSELSFNRKRKVVRKKYLMIKSMDILTKCLCPVSLAEWWAGNWIAMCFVVLFSMFKSKEKQGFILWKGQTIYMVNWILSILNAQQWWPDSWLGAVRPWAMTRSTADRCQCYVMFNEQDSKTIYWVN